MKTLKLFLLFVFAAVCANAASPMQRAIEEALSKKVDEQKSASKADAKPANAAASPSNPQQRALKAVIDKNPFNESYALSFSDFLNKSNQTDRKNQQAHNIQWQADALFGTAFWLKGRPQLMFQGTPNYSKDIAEYMKGYNGKKYIFVSEKSDHDQAALVKHMVKILGILRKDNPNAKILLASEFSTVSNESTLPIRFSRKKNEGFSTYEGYGLLEAAADTDGFIFDILALDDLSFKDTATTRFAKVGPKYVAFNPKDSRLKRIADDFGLNPNDPMMVYAAFQYFLVSNMYGVDLRNQQWASYIKAVEPYYDIIVVYGGSGHLSISGLVSSVPLMLNPARAVLISLNSREKLSDEAQQHYETRERIQDEFSAKRDSIPEPEYIDDGKGREDLSDAPDYKVDFSRPHYRRENGIVFTNWYRQHIRNQEAFDKYQQQYANFERLVGKSPLHYPKWLTYDVYMD